MDADSIYRLLESGVEAGVFPGAQAVVFHEGEVVGPVCAGATSYAAYFAPEPVVPDTRYDLASLTKAIVTAPLLWYAIDKGIVAPDAPVSRWLGDWTGQVEGDSTTIMHLASHTAGLPAWLPLHQDASLEGLEGAAAVRQMCRLVLGVQAQQGAGKSALYSDIGFILLAFALERALGAGLDVLAQEHVLGPLGMSGATFVKNHEGERLHGRVAATELTRDGVCLSGVVHDENARALGGVAGHAGLFGTSSDVLRFCEAILRSDGGPPAPWAISPATVRWAMSERAACLDADGNRLGTHLGGLDTPSGSASTAGPFVGTAPPGTTVGHLGFTGTSMWVDRSRDLAVVLLTNRVHPSRDNEAMRAFRVRFHSEVTASVSERRQWSFLREVPSYLRPGPSTGGELELRVAIDAARRAGVMARHRFEEGAKVLHKSDLELVTQVDLDCEKLILETISAAFPGHGFLAEETGEISNDSPYVWIIDPIDGTTNFAHQTPHFAVCIALMVHGELQLGVIYDPMRDELFSARRGDGARLNGRPISVSGCRSLSRSLAATGFPYDRHTSANNNVDNLAEMIKVVQGLRRMGSAGLDMAYVAAGRLDLYWELRVKPWDIAAGIVLVQEAGGRVSDVLGGRFDMDAGDILASCGPIQSEAAECLTQVAMARKK